MIGIQVTLEFIIENVSFLSRHNSGSQLRDAVFTKCKWSRVFEKPPRSRCALMIRPIQTKIGHDQTHPDDNLP